MYTTEYEKAAHAMQSGVQATIDLFPEEAGTTPKHLRTGINSAMVEHSALVNLLIERDVFTEKEYADAVVAAMQKEVKRFETLLSERTGKTIKLA